MQVADLFAKLTLRPDKKSFDAADKMLGAVKTALYALAAVKTVQALGNMVEKTVQMGSAAVDAGTKLGISSQELQSLEFAAQTSHVEVENVTMAYAHMSKGLQEARTKGTGPFVDAMAELGISMDEPAIKARNLPAIFDLVADKMHDSTDAQVKLSSAMNLAGRGGAALIPLWSKGSARIAELRKEAVDLGYAMTDEANAGLKAFGGQMHEIQGALVGVRNEAVVAILPYLKELIDDFAAWVKENKKLLAQRLAAVIRGVAFALQLIGKVAAFVIDGLQWMAKNFGFVIAAMSAVGIAFALYKAKAIQTAIATAVAWLEAVAPFVLLAAIILGVILVVEDLYTWLVGGDSIFKEFYEAAKRWIGEKLVAIFNKAWHAWQNFKDAFSSEAGTEKGMQKALHTQEGQVFASLFPGSKLAEDAAKVRKEDVVAGDGFESLKEGGWSGDASEDLISGNKWMVSHGFQKNSQGAWMQSPWGAPPGGIDTKAQIDIHLPPGVDAKEVATATKDAFAEFFGSELRRLRGANGGNR